MVESLHLPDFKDEGILSEVDVSFCSSGSSLRTSLSNIFSGDLDKVTAFLPAVRANHALRQPVPPALEDTLQDPEHVHAQESNVVEIQLPRS